eukprot:6213823-Pleurochrysis_carterae.AAC.4
MLKLESWIGLESNPEVMTQYAEELGVSSSWGFTDCFGFDADALSYVPKPCVAAIFLYPFSLVEARKRAVGAQRGETNPRVWHMKQSVANACGAVAIMHAVMNNLDRLGRSSRFLDDFKDSTRSSSAEARGLAFAPAVREIHSGIAARGQTDAPRPTADLDFHFLSYVEVDNRLYELGVYRQLHIHFYMPAFASSIWEIAFRA